MIAAALSALLLVSIIRAFTDEEVSFLKAFVISLFGAVVGQILTTLACRPIDGLVARIIVELLIKGAVVGISVQFLCSTDLRTTTKIVLSYLAVVIVFTVSAFVVLALYVSGK